jgi:hypothetical protein
MIVKVFLTSLNLLLVQKTHLSPFAVGKLIDHRTAYIKCHEIVDTGTDVSPDGSKQDNQEYV